MASVEVEVETGLGSAADDGGQRVELVVVGGVTREGTVVVPKGNEEGAVVPPNVNVGGVVVAPKVNEGGAVEAAGFEFVVDDVVVVDEVIVGEVIVVGEVVVGEAVVGDEVVAVALSEFVGFVGSPKTEHWGFSILLLAPNFTNSQKTWD